MEDTSGGMLEGPGLYPDPSVNTGYQTTWGRQGREPEKVEFDLTGPGKSTIANNLVDNIVDTRSACEYENTNQVPNTQDQHVDTDASSQDKRCVDVMSSEKTTLNSGLTVLMLAPLLALASTLDDLQDLLDLHSFVSFNSGITSEESKEVMKALNAKKRFPDILSRYKSICNQKLENDLFIEKVNTRNGVDCASDYPSDISSHPLLEKSRLIEVDKQLNMILVCKKQKMLERWDPFQTDGTQKIVETVFQNEAASNDSQEKGLPADHGSNTPWKKCVKEESCQRVFKQNPPWPELDIKGKRIKVFGMKSSMSIPVHDSYKIAVLL